MSRSPRPPAHRSRRARCTWTLVAGVVLVAACGGGSSTADERAGDAETATTVNTADDVAEQSDTPATSRPEATDVSDDTDTDAAADTDGTVEHALGAVDIVTDPTRVVALDRSLIDAALALELPLAGYTTYNDPGGALPEYFGDALTYADGAEWVGDLLDPNIEAIAALDPDLILMTAVRHEDLYDEFSAIAPTVATESAGGGWKDNIRLVAAATGRTALGESILAEYEQRAAAVGAAVNAAGDDPTISVVRFADAIRLYQPVSFSGVVLEDAGLARPESQQDRDDFIAIISEEELGLAEADVLIYTVASHEAVEQMAVEVQQRPLWQSLTAVQEGRAHPVLDDSWMSGVGVFGAHLILDDLEAIFGLG